MSTLRGKLVKKIRAESHGGFARRVGGMVNHRFALLEGLTRAGLHVAGYAQDLLGDRRLQRLSGAVSRVSGERIPRWHADYPRASAGIVRRDSLICGSW